MADRELHIRGPLCPTKGLIPLNMCMAPHAVGNPLVVYRLQYTVQAPLNSGTPPQILYFPFSSPP